MQNLVIVESPAKAKTIEKFLGKDYKVMSSYGHIRDLKKKNFGVDLNTFEPEYEIPEDKKHIVSELRSAARKAGTIWLASDEDREGEAISWHLAEVLKLDPATARRIVFHEITKPAILEAIAHPRTIDINLVDAQQTRRVLDRLVGFKISPVLWRKVRPSLSAGRVQSVAVRLIVEREREIAAFVPTTSYRVVAIFTHPSWEGGNTLRAELAHRFDTAAEAEDFLHKCAKATFTVESITKRPTKRTPAPPFTTSTLQQEAARKLGFPVALTMRVAQGLYESGLITYMRTDSMNLSDLCLTTCVPVITGLMGEAYPKTRRYHTKSKGAQEAHEAIRPTDMRRQSISGTAQEKRLYDLIWKRTIACQMADAKLEKTTVSILMEADGETAPWQFNASGEVVKFDGFLRVYRESRDEDEDGDEGRILPAMKKGQTLTYSEITAQQRYSQEPTRYNEASLVRKLEELGIGRPSTYAPTISTIQQREYVRRGESDGEKRDYEVLTLTDGTVQRATLQETVGADKGRMLPTDTGVVVNDFLTENFPDIFEYNFTADVEQDFDRVADGKKAWRDVIRAFYDTLDPAVQHAMTESGEHRAGERILGTDPATGKPVKVRIGRFGPMAQIGSSEDEEKPRFATLLKTQSIQSITLEEALDLFRLPRELGEYEGQVVKVGAGRFGPYVQHAGKYCSLDKGENPVTVTLDRAIALILSRREAEEKSHLKTFDEDPDMEIRQGRFGPYIAYKGKNYRIPKPKAAMAKELSFADCQTIIEAEKGRTAKRKK